VRLPVGNVEKAIERKIGHVGHISEDAPRHTRAHTRVVTAAGRTLARFRKEAAASSMRARTEEPAIAKHHGRNRAASEHDVEKQPATGR
jgi:hypothetical protein